MANEQPVIRQANSTGKLTAPPTTTVMNAAKCTVFEAVIVILGHRGRERSRSLRNLPPQYSANLVPVCHGQFGRQVSENAEF